MQFYEIPVEILTKWNKKFKHIITHSLSMPSQAKPADAIFHAPTKYGGFNIPLLQNIQKQAFIASQLNFILNSQTKHHIHIQQAINYKDGKRLREKIHHELYYTKDQRQKYYPSSKVLHLLKTSHANIVYHAFPYLQRVLRVLHASKSTLLDTASIRQTSLHTLINRETLSKIPDGSIIQIFTDGSFMASRFSTQFILSKVKATNANGPPVYPRASSAMIINGIKSDLVFHTIGQKTSQNAELQAIEAALLTVPIHLHVEIISDCQNAINLCNALLKQKHPPSSYRIPNLPTLKRLHFLLHKRGSLKVTFKHVPSHTKHNKPNEHTAKKLADAFQTHGNLLPFLIDGNESVDDLVQKI